MRAIVALVLALAIGLGCGKRLPAPLDAYPDSEGLGRIARWHLTRTKYHKSPMAVLISWSRGGTARNWGGVVVDEKGNAFSFRYLHDHALQGGGITGVGRPKDVATVAAYLGTLGKSVKPPAIEDVLIVSFEHRGNWETRLYHRDHAPTELAALYRYLAKRTPASDPQAPWAYRRK